MSHATVVTFNVKWQSRTSPNGRMIWERIQQEMPDVVCLTEAHDGWSGGCGYELLSEADYGLGPQGSRRKVVLWSREPWTTADHCGDPDLPSGRFVSGRTKTPIGEVHVRGVCIPYPMALVVERKVAKWSEHLRYLDALQPLLRERRRTVVVGDFNQKLPRQSEPRVVADKLVALFQGMDIPTRGLSDETGRGAIDHITVTSDLRTGRPRVLSRFDGARELSDHFGVVLDLFDPVASASAQRELLGEARSFRVRDFDAYRIS